MRCGGTRYANAPATHVAAARSHKGVTAQKNMKNIEIQAGNRQCCNCWAEGRALALACSRTPLQQQTFDAKAVRIRATGKIRNKQFEGRDAQQMMNNE
jgi:hypothetical protein